MLQFTHYLWYPFLLGNAVLLFAALRSTHATLVPATYGPILLTGLALAALERARPARRAWRPPFIELRRDLLYMLLVQGLLPRALMLATVMLLARAGVGLGDAGLWPSHWPYAAQVSILLVAADFLRYWLHRASHVWMPLWRLHEVHHAPGRLYALNVGRFHPLEKVLHFAVDSLPFVLLGATPEVLAGYYLLYAVNGQFQHANVRLRYGWSNYLVGSAETHRWHHVRDEARGQCNFGATLIVWDLLFGTFHLPRRQPRAVGILDSSYPQGFVMQLLRPFHASLAQGVLGARLMKLALLCVLYREALRLGRHTADPMARQRALLRQVLHDNRDTVYGRAHGFADIRGYGDFVARVPINDYEALRPYIEREMTSGEATLTAERPLRYVATSGTTGAPKHVPITRAVERHLARMQRLAAALQFRACPRAFDGALLVIAGCAEETRSADGRSIGAASGLLAGHTPALLRERFVLPPGVATITDATLKYLLVLRLALARPDISLCATANVSTLLTLQRLYAEHRAALLEDLRVGGFHRAADLPASLRAELAPRLIALPARAAELARLGAQAEFGALWPRLAAVATWTGGSAGIGLARLRRVLAADCRILELGYLASECRATLTLGRRAGTGLPTLDGNFFEFAERDAWEAGDRRLVTLDALRKGHDYYVVITTRGGLYRYFINDLVRVTGHLGRTPLLRFVQKGRGVTSLTGEKLYEAQFLAALAEVAASANLQPALALALADENRGGYDVYLECDGERPAAATLGAALDAALARHNPEYASKRAGERLASPRLCWLRAGTHDALRAWRCARGQREAQFKLVSLDYRARFDFDLDACVEQEVHA